VKEDTSSIQLEEKKEEKNEKKGEEKKKP